MVIVLHTLHTEVWGLSMLKTLKNGNFGYVYKKKTRYVCLSSGVAKSTCVNHTTDGQVERVTKSNDEALGGNSTSIDRGAAFRLEISGVESRRAGSIESESSRNENIQEDY